MLPLKALEPGVARFEPRVRFLQLLGFALELPHPLLVRDLPLLVFDLSALELDLSELVVDNGSLVQHRQQAPEPAQRGVVLRFADRGRRHRGREGTWLYDEKEDQRQQAAQEQGEPTLDVE